MNIYCLKLILIVLIHIVWLFSLVMVGSYGESTDMVVKAISFLLTEPIFVLTIHIVVLYLVINLILKIRPLDKRTNKRLLTISIIITIMVCMRVVLLYISEIMIQGFSLFVYKEYWGGILF